MRIAILLGGTGSRFAEAGYATNKSLLLVDGKPMLSHVLSMYPGEHEFIFVAGEHLADHPTFTSIAASTPNSRVVVIPSHKLGPVHTASYIWKDIPQDEGLLISYCDFGAQWDFADFSRKIASDSAPAGAIPAYTGFHPHLLRRKKYAGMLVDPQGLITAIQEKHSFTDNPQDSYHSAGNYYFSRVGEMREYGEALLRSGETLSGEQYVSMLYYTYLKDGKPLLAYPLQKFLQWGTPEDLEEYEAWSRMINGEGKATTDIPPSRNALVKIPYREGSPEYRQSHEYWREYFSK